MVEEAYQLLGLSPEADARAIESTYWRLVREVSALRKAHPEADEELERINWAYKTLIDHLRRRSAPRQEARQRSLPWRRAAALALAAALAVVGLGGGLSYRDQIADHAALSAEKAKDRWEATITWLQKLGEEQHERRQPPGDALSR